MNHKKLSKAAELARRRAAAQQSSGGTTLLSVPAGTEFFSIKKGKYLVDILNYKVGKGNPWAKPGEYYYERTYFVHPNIGADNKPYVCPRLTCNLPCPICEYRAKLMKKGAEREILAALKPRERQLFNVVDVTNGPNDKVLLWDISNFCFGAQLNGEINDADDESIAAFAEWKGGYTLKLGVDEEKGAGYTFPKVNRISFRPRGRDYDDSIEEKLLCLDDLLVIPDYDVLKKEFLLAEDLDEDFEPLPRRSSVTVPQPIQEAEEEEEDIEESEPVASKPTTSKPVQSAKSKIKEVEEDDEWDKWDDDEEEEQPVAKKEVSKPKKQVKEEDIEEEEEEPVAKPVKSSKSASKPAKKKEIIWEDEEEEEEEEDDWDDWDDEELEEDEEDN